PEIAAQRRPRDNPERLAEIWNRKWPTGYAHVVDAAKSLNEVQQQIRKIIWAGLQKQPKIIELVGLSGAGKTTVAKRLAKETCHIQTATLWKDHKLQCLKCIVRKLPNLFYLTLCGVPLQHLRRMLSLENVLAILQRHKKVHLLACRTLVLDSGPIQALAYLKNEGTKETIWIKTLEARTIQTVDRLVFLDAPTEVLRNRINQRETQHRIKNKMSEEVEQFCNDYHICYERIIGDQPGRIPVKYVNTAINSVESVSEEVKNLL
ncbi:MAG: AAA family ATPase, partial [Planctomycetota bacterium]